MLNATNTPRWRAWLLLAVACWAGVAPAFATAFASGFSFRGPETRVWNFFPQSAETRQENEPQVADSHQGNEGHGYEIASGVHVYLYAHANPITYMDPSGHYSLGQVLAVVFVIDTLAHMAMASASAYLNPTDENLKEVGMEVAFAMPWGKMARLFKTSVASTSFISRIYKETLAAGAFLGRAARKNYTKTFFLAFPHLKGKVVVHHAIPQKVLTEYPGLLTEEALHSLENLRGIPNAINNELHLSAINGIWNEFYRKFPAGKPPTLKQLLDQAHEIDEMFGHLFTPSIP